MLILIHIIIQNFQKRETESVINLLGILDGHWGDFGSVSQWNG